MLVILSGCSVVGSKNQNNNEALKKMGVAYSTGDYVLEGASCFGFISSGQSALRLSIPVAKRFLEGQTITVKSINNVQLRAEGKYVASLQADLTQYVAGAYMKNDGAVLYICLDNSDKWKDSDNKVLPNNIVVSGAIDISFSVVDHTK